MWWFALGLVRPANGRGLPFYSLGFNGGAVALHSQGREPLVRIGQTYVERRSRGIDAVLATLRCDCVG